MRVQGHDSGDSDLIHRCLGEWTAIFNVYSECTENRLYDKSISVNIYYIRSDIIVSEHSWTVIVTVTL